MADTSGIVTIDYVLKSFLNLKGWGTADYDRYKQIMIEGFSDLNVFHTDYVQTVQATVNSVNQFRIPSDYIDWVGVEIDLNGEYWPLDHNKKLIIEPFNEADTIVHEDHLNVPDQEGNRYTATRRNQYGQFNIDKEARVCMLKGDYRGYTVYLKYMSSGVPGEGIVYVPRELRMTLTTYLEWQLKEMNDMVSMGVKMRAEQQHGRALVEYYEWKDQLTGKEFLDLFRNGIQQGIKR